MLSPIDHANIVTGRRQSALVDLWKNRGFIAAISDVDGPRIYNYGSLPYSTIAITLYDVKRHVLIEDGRVRRDGPVKSGWFRIGQPFRSVVVDAIPDSQVGKLIIFYLDNRMMDDVSAGSQQGGRIALRDQAWDLDDPFLALCANRLVQASEQSQTISPLLTEQFSYTLALHLCDNYSVRISTEKEYNIRISDVICARIAELIRSDPTRDLSLAELAKIADLSTSRFIRYFKQATGKTPHRFVIEQRIRHAEDLIVSTDMALAEVALASGFSSQSHLGVAFRTITGRSPGVMRRDRRTLS